MTREKARAKRTRLVGIREGEAVAAPTPARGPTRALDNAAALAAPLLLPREKRKPSRLLKNLAHALARLGRALEVFGRANLGCHLLALPRARVSTALSGGPQGLTHAPPASSPGAGSSSAARRPSSRRSEDPSCTRRGGSAARCRSGGPRRSTFPENPKTKRVSHWHRSTRAPAARQETPARGLRVGMLSRGNNLPGRCRASQASRRQSR